MVQGDTYVLDDIPLRLDVDRLAKQFHVRPDTDLADQLRSLVDQAQGIGRPKALFRVAYIASRDADGVVIDDVRLASRVLRVNVESAYRVFLYNATCGTELDAWEQAMDDILHQYWADAIKQQALGAAIKALNTEIEERFRPGKTATMAPGSLLDWPLREQRRLFALLGDTEATIGVRLTPSCLMVPNKSVSGIRFPAEESFASCMLCPREACPGRRAEFAPALYESKYGLSRPLREGELG